jgi:hypothetical protein
MPSLHDLLCATVRTLLLLGQVAFLASSEAEGEEPGPDPLALLRGVEAARLAIPSGQIEWRVERTRPLTPKYGKDLIRVFATFDGGKRRFEEHKRVLWTEPVEGASQRSPDDLLAAMDEDREEFVRAGFGQWKEVRVRSIFDGTQFLQFLGGSGATIADPSRGTPNYVFDPRILGITPLLSLKATVPRCLAYRDAQSVELVGEEDIDGQQAWHVKVVGSPEAMAECHFWIEANEPFAVYRCERRTPYSHDVSVSHYDSPSGADRLPTRVLIEYHQDNGEVSHRFEFTQVEAQFGINPDDGAFTLAGLDLPVGAPVVDVRIHQRLGYWNGKGLSHTRTAAMGPRYELEPTPPDTRVWYLVLALLPILIVAVILYRHHRFKQAQSE